MTPRTIDSAYKWLPERMTQPCVFNYSVTIDDWSVIDPSTVVTVLNSHNLRFVIRISSSLYLTNWIKPVMSISRSFSLMSSLWLGIHTGMSRHVHVVRDIISQSRLGVHTGMSRHVHIVRNRISQSRFSSEEGASHNNVSPSHHTTTSNNHIA